MYIEKKTLAYALVQFVSSTCTYGARFDHCGDNENHCIDEKALTMEEGSLNWRNVLQGSMCRLASQTSKYIIIDGVL